MTQKLKGFAAIKAKDPDRQREIARKGGAGVPADKRSFATDRELAAAAGRQGGLATGNSRRSAR